MNDYIEDYCKEYITSKYNLDFSILLKGPWGCGKTFFINNLIDNIIEDKDNELEKNNIIYISVFGISSIADIEEKLFTAMHPLLASQGMKLAGTFLKQALKLGINLDLNSDGKKDSTINISGLVIDRKLKDKSINKKLIIIDDIERSSLKPNQLLGYFSDFILEQGIKIIFIGNEEEYIKNEDAYSRIKEKVIGYTFEVLPDLDSAIKSFLQEYEIEIANAYNIILRTINRLKNNNLRLIRRGIRGVKRLLTRIPDEYQKDEYVSKILETFLVLFIQYSSGNLKEEDINDALKAYFSYNVDILKYKKMDEKEIKYSFCIEWIPLKNSWKYIIFKTILDEKMLIKNVSEDFKVLYPKPDESESNLVRLLKDWYKMESECFKTHYDNLIDELKTGVYKHPGELLHSFALFYRYSEYKIIPCEIKDVERFFYDLVMNNKDSITSINFRNNYLDSYMGYGFPNGIEEFNNFKKHIIKISDGNYREKLKTMFISNVSNLDKNIDNIILHLRIANGTGKYNKYPVLSWINPEDLFENLITLDFEKQNSFIYALNERYGKIYSNVMFPKEYYDDYDNVYKLKELYLKEFNKWDKEYMPKKVSYMRIVNSLDDLIKYLDECKKKNEE